MKAVEFLELLNLKNIDHFYGVPDSQLKALSDCLFVKYKISENNVIAHNEGGALAMAAGYYLATGKTPCVYMQNSGIGNIVNPVCSLTGADIYAIPTVFVIGWRGQPGVKDEPQHVYQGKVTVKLLEDLDIKYLVITKSSTLIEVESYYDKLSEDLLNGRSVAFVIEKDALQADEVKYCNSFDMSRENAIEIISQNRSYDIFVTTTGKASREMFELREQRNELHTQDFLTVGSMGHAAMIALGIATEKTDKMVFCLDGDGAVLMHMGSLALIGSKKPSNFIHVLLNNEAHETVGGMPTVSNQIDFCGIAQACGYLSTFCVDSEKSLLNVLNRIDEIQKPVMIEIKLSISSRNDLGRPTTTPLQNKQEFMKFLGV